MLCWSISLVRGLGRVGGIIREECPNWLDEIPSFSFLPLFSDCINRKQEFARNMLDEWFHAPAIFPVVWGEMFLILISFQLGKRKTDSKTFFTASYLSLLIKSKTEKRPQKKGSGASKEFFKYSYWKLKGRKIIIKRFSPFRLRRESNMIALVKLSSTPAPEK